ncbi:MAG: TonB family protein [Magnetospirillum gryphiswaldense]|nr:TonB family protein [Magnetospirillum gryphiswaldense]
MNDVSLPLSALAHDLSPRATFLADRPLIRWSSALTLVLALHGGAIVATLAWASQQPPSAPPPAAVMIDLAPAPAAPPAEPRTKETPPEPPKPQPKPKPKPRPKQAELALPKPAPEPPRPSLPPAEPMTAPPLPTAPQPAAPAAGPVSAAPTSNALPTWQGTLLAHLEKHKRYPRSAQLRRQQGVSHVVFTIDRRGNVLAARLHKGSGFDSLDNETLDLLNRAQPLPPPPPEITGERIELMVPVQFYLR